MRIPVVHDDYYYAGGSVNRLGTYGGFQVNSHFLLPFDRRRNLDSYHAHTHPHFFTSYFFPLWQYRKKVYRFLDAANSTLPKHQTTHNATCNASSSPTRIQFAPMDHLFFATTRAMAVFAQQKYRHKNKAKQCK